jgi:hypothetical protein
MGCDIHAVIERKSTHRWLCSGDPDIGRNYEMFAALAGVRNRDGITPVAEPRGFPSFKDWVDGHSNGERWMRFATWEDQPCSSIVDKAETYGLDGHSHSWLTLAEIKAYDTDQVIYDSRLILSRDKSGRAKALCTATSGEHFGPVGKTKILRWPGEEEPESWLRLIRYMEQAKWDGQTDDEIRLVFFFDN